MANETKELEVYEWLAERADTWSAESGLKEDYQPVAYAGFCVALQMFAFALRLPVDHEVEPTESDLGKAVAARFHAPEATMKQPSNIKCQCCAAVYEDDPLRMKQWWSGAQGHGACAGIYRVMPFDEDESEHLCGQICLMRRLAQVCKPEPVRTKGSI